MPNRDRFVTLDGMRGVAALVVAVLHVSRMAGLDVAPHANLAVDFFFVLSGFVIAHAYDDRLGRSLTAREFVKRRLIRLHPLIVLGAAIGLAPLVGQSARAGGEDLLGILWAGVAGVLLVPYHQLDVAEAFPLNGPTWSLFAEYAVNLLFAAVAVSLTLRRLTALLVFGVTMLLVVVSLYGTVGDVWQSETIALSLLRVVYPFFAGVLISRLYRSGLIAPPALPAWVPIAGLLAILLAPQSQFDPAFELTMIVFGFPLLVIAGINDRCGASSSKAMLWAGALSYPLYILHYPVGKAVAPLMLALAGDHGPVAAIVAILTAIVIASWAALRYFDEPVRAWLTAGLHSRRAALQA